MSVFVFRVRSTWHHVRLGTRGASYTEMLRRARLSTRCVRACIKLSMTPAAHTPVYGSVYESCRARLSHLSMLVSRLCWQVYVVHTRVGSGVHYAVV